SGSVWESNPPRPALCDPPPVLKTGKPTGTQTPPQIIIAHRGADFQAERALHPSQAGPIAGTAHAIVAAPPRDVQCIQPFQKVDCVAAGRAEVVAQHADVQRLAALQPL